MDNPMRAGDSDIAKLPHARQPTGVSDGIARFDSK